VKNHISIKILRFTFVIGAILLSSCSYIDMMDNDNPCFERPNRPCNFSLYRDTLWIGDLRLEATTIALNTSNYIDDAVWIGPLLLPIFPKTPVTDPAGVELTFFNRRDSVLIDLAKIHLLIANHHEYLPDSASDNRYHGKKLPMSMYVSNTDINVVLWFPLRLRDYDEFTIDIRDAFACKSNTPLIRYRKKVHYLYLPAPIH
jgi:hypothetical protein